MYYNCTFALFIFCLHKLGIEAHAYAHNTSLLCFYTTKGSWTYRSPVSSLLGAKSPDTLLRTTDRYDYGPYTKPNKVMMKKTIK